VLAIHGPLVWRGRLAWRLKRYLDKKFVREYRYPKSEPEDEGAPLAAKRGEARTAG
jgi:hypothetical protein